MSDGDSIMSTSKREMNRKQPSSQTEDYFEPTVMFFGLTNSLATFHTLMNAIFGDLIAMGKVAVYLDDILIFTKELDEHWATTKEVLH